MKKTPHINIDVFEGNDSYKLLDSGNKCKLEEVGGVRIARSEPRAWWKCGLGEEEWRKAVAYYKSGSEVDKAKWQFKKDIPHEFAIEIAGLKVLVKMQGTTKHIGIFPEQAGQWKFIEEKIKNASRHINVLNLFGYTGIASLVSAKAGVNVTHVDGSKASIAWAKENQELSGLKDAPIRWILDDASDFIKREAKRGTRYDAIIMDPPTFGRGPSGEVWKIENDLVPLLKLCGEVLSPQPLFFLINIYATELSSLSLSNLLEDAMEGLVGREQAARGIEIGELTIKEKSRGRLLPTAIFAKWSSE